ncbi:hypothetical protein KGP36_02575 [Patescibacteria group bacterium]|nr:hypothetical protein [Patescibacteria group bacterium]
MKIIWLIFAFLPGFAAANTPTDTPTFTVSPTYSVTQTPTLTPTSQYHVLVVGGGGGGGAGVAGQDWTMAGGGGGGGQVLDVHPYLLNGNTYLVHVGASVIHNTQGQNSFFDVYQAYGGGAGATDGVGGGCGGNGGGGFAAYHCPASCYSSSNGGGTCPSPLPTPGSSNPGGNGFEAVPQSVEGGGGGGANGGGGTNAGNGGLGFASNISGATVYYGGGGGAGNTIAVNCFGTLPGGIGGGGNGAYNSTKTGCGCNPCAAGWGFNNRGGGGGGGCYNYYSDRNGLDAGHGGSGVVFLSYSSSLGWFNATGNYVTSTASGANIYEWLSGDGSITINSPFSPTPTAAQTATPTPTYTPPAACYPYMVQDETLTATNLPELQFTAQTNHCFNCTNVLVLATNNTDNQSVIDDVMWTAAGVWYPTLQIPSNQWHEGLEIWTNYLETPLEAPYITVISPTYDTVNVVAAQFLQFDGTEYAPGYNLTVTASTVSSAFLSSTLNVQYVNGTVLSVYSGAKSLLNWPPGFGNLGYWHGYGTWASTDSVFGNIIGGNAVTFTANTYQATTNGPAAVSVQLELPPITNNQCAPVPTMTGTMTFTLTPTISPSWTVSPTATISPTATPSVTP